MADGVLGALLRRCPMARLRRGAFGRGARRDGRSRAPLRGALMATRRRHHGSDLGARVLAAIPAIVFAAIIVGYGGVVWALGVSFLGIVCLAELYRLMGRVHPANVAGFISVVALALAALYGDHFQVVPVLVAGLPVTFF